MHFQPTPCDGELQVAEQERAVELLDIDAAFLNRLNLTFPCLVNGTAAPSPSLQFGTMFTEPAAPHSLQTRRQPIVDQGKSWTIRRSQIPPEHWMLQVT
jgi:hypothetical protein